MEHITSAKNPVVKGLRALRDRKGREAAGRFLVEGEVMIREALKCGLTVRDVLAPDLDGGVKRAVEQRNRLLKEEWPDQALLSAWDASVALGGATLLQSRLRLFERLRAHMERIYLEISQGETLSCSYECSLGEGVGELTRDELADRFAARLLDLRKDELRRQQTLVGPQRDDVTFAIDGRDARAFGSQGQQRSIVLAWKMAEVELCEEVVGDKPLLLLDDVMSELDEVRRDAVTRFVQGGIQTVVTTTNLGYFPDELLDRAKVVSFGE